MGSNPTRGTFGIFCRLEFNLSSHDPQISPSRHASAHPSSGELSAGPDIIEHVYDPDLRARACALIAAGHSVQEVSQSLGVPHFTLVYWRDHPALPRTCPRCAERRTLPEPRRDYAYLLGLYLGDGCINVMGDPKKRVWVLRIACADKWPGLTAECKRAMSAIRPDNKVSTQQSIGCSYVLASSRHWPCLLPQHGPGPKHLRRIAVVPWQQEIVTQFPGDFARSLFHSDGCRFTNRVRHQLSDGDRWYCYPRYMFTNESADIRTLCGQALDKLGVAWRYSRRNTISVARREAVARLDEFVGPKY